MTIEINRRPMSRARLASLAEAQFGDMVKAVVDVERGVMAIGGELQADEEAALMEDESAQEHLWGINLYPAEKGEGYQETKQRQAGNRLHDVGGSQNPAAPLRAAGEKDSGWDAQSGRHDCGHQHEVQVLPRELQDFAGMREDIVQKVHGRSRHFR